MVELLAPAGEYSSFLGAINAGADAVYLAGNMYGARASAKNFTSEEIIQAIKYAHLFNRKVFLTVNTLTKNEELEYLFDFLYPLYNNGLDAVIVQDIGVFKYIKECFPSLDIHMSTQSVITSKEGASFYKELGAKRVVLARELTLPEIKEITELGIETECFIHGAMCYSYSGMCLFSSFLGGNSGNRGRCKGPCRQPYVIDNKEGYYLSLADMNTIEIMDKLIGAGIYSYKIEGRLKSPAYSAGVTSIYRKYIDRYLENPGKEYKVDKEDIDFLKKLYSRKSTGTGYYERVSSPKMVTMDKGAYLKVDEDIENRILDEYVNNTKKHPIDMSLFALSNQKAVLSASLKINDIDIYESFESSDVIEKASNKITGEEDIKKHIQKLGNTNYCINNLTIEINDGFVPASLLNNLRRELIEKIDIAVNDVINKNDNREAAVRSSVKKIADNAGYSPKDDISKEQHKPLNRAFIDNYSQLKTLADTDFFDAYILSDDLYNSLSKKELSDIVSLKKKAECYVRLPFILRSLNRDYCLSLIEKSKNDDCISGIFVNQYDTYKLVKDSGYDKKIHADYGIYNFNSVSKSINEKLFDGTEIPFELSIRDINGIDYINSGIVVYGKAPLMQTANCVRKTTGQCIKAQNKNSDKPDSYIYIKDRLGVEFPVRIRCNDSLCLNTIYNSKPNSLHKYIGSLYSANIQFFDYCFTDENDTDIARIVYDFKELFDGQKMPKNLDYTAFHIKNGVN